MTLNISVLNPIEMLSLIEHFDGLDGIPTTVVWPTAIKISVGVYMFFNVNIHDGVRIVRITPIPHGNPNIIYSYKTYMKNRGQFFPAMSNNIGINVLNYGNRSYSCQGTDEKGNLLLKMKVHDIKDDVPILTPSSIKVPFNAEEMKVTDGIFGNMYNGQYRPIGTVIASAEKSVVDLFRYSIKNSDHNGVVDRLLKAFESLGIAIENTARRSALLFNCGFSRRDIKITLHGLASEAGLTDAILKAFNDKPFMYAETEPYKHGTTIWKEDDFHYITNGAVGIIRDIKTSRKLNEYDDDLGQSPYKLYGKVYLAYPDVNREIEITNALVKILL